MQRLAILDDYEDLALKLGDWDRLAGKVQIDAYHDHLQAEAQLVQRLAPYDILLVMRERTPFPRSLIAQLPNLRLLVTTGHRNQAIDLAACGERGIVVCGTDSGKAAAAEHTWGLILALFKKLPQTDRVTRAGRWGGEVTTELNGKTLGILGLGRLGVQVARVGLAFGMQVIAWSQNLTAERAAEYGVARVEKDDLLRAADIVTVHLVLSARTRDLIGAREFGLMKPTAYLVNTSRGPIVEETALVEALRGGRIAGAGIDVFAAEPLPAAHPLLKLDNAVVTPHMGYVTRENFEVYFKQAVEDVAAWLAGRPIRVLEA